MIQINLLPVRQIRARLQARNDVAIFGAVLFVVVTSVFLGTMKMISDVESLQVENKALEEKKASYQRTINEINQLKKDKETMQTKINVIKSLKENSQVSVRVLDEMANLVPAKRLWLKNLAQSGNDLNISGVALDNATIAQFMNNISASDQFNGSELATSSQTVVAGAKLKSFSLKIILKTKSVDKPKQQQKGK